MEHQDTEERTMTTKRSDYKEINGYCPYDPTDRMYKGAKKIVDAEMEHIQHRRPEATPQDLTGLALSGGGIRSASFSLGVMQAMARKGWLNRFDYLSTVSGGGYIGSSLTWLLHKQWDCSNADNQKCSVQFGLEDDTFPFKTEPVWSTKTTSAASAAVDTSGIPKNVKGSMLRWLRQNGKYLTPGGCHNFAALVAVVLRGSILSGLVYLSLLVLLFMGLNLNVIGAFDSVTWKYITAPKALLVAGVGGVLFVILTLIYSISTSLFGLSDHPEPTGEHLAAQLFDRLLRFAATKRYCWRRFVECSLGRMLVAVLVIAGIGVLPLIPEAFQALFTKETKEQITTAFGVFSALAGLFSSIGVFTQSSKQKKSQWMPVLIGVAVTLLTTGVLLLAYQIAIPLREKFPEVSNIFFIAPFAMMIIIGAISNLNYISVHRYYRDRLMETFMPDVANAVQHDNSCPGLTRDADSAPIQTMCDGDSGAPGPYHIINTNIVLVQSKTPKFKGRGGDNFILSPHYCGSNATGWRSSHQFMGGGMTLATAMAISGAAVNPSAGCGGEGVTRQPILSMLMGLLNIRLGYWAPNPNPEKEALWYHTPNFIFPGLWELLLRRNLNENSRFIQLSDGGHFENLGLYELVRRRLKLIVICDGGADPEFTFSDLANAIEKVRADFGTLISIECKDLEPLSPRSRGTANSSECPERFAERGHIIANIYYPDNTQGKLIYLTTTFTRNLSADLYGYRNEHPEFPDEPTGDQFFDEKQFEAYRELGFQLAWNMFNDAQRYFE